MRRCQTYDPSPHSVSIEITPNLSRRFINARQTGLTPTEIPISEILDARDTRGGDGATEFFRIDSFHIARNFKGLLTVAFYTNAALSPNVVFTFNNKTIATFHRKIRQNLRLGWFIQQTSTVIYIRCDLHKYANRRYYE